MTPGISGVGERHIVMAETGSILLISIFSLVVCVENRLNNDHNAKNENTCASGYINNDI